MSTPPSEPIDNKTNPNTLDQDKSKNLLNSPENLPKVGLSSQKAESFFQTPTDQSNKR
jgi:hypothetical protein